MGMRQKFSRRQLIFGGALTTGIASMAGTGALLLEQPDKPLPYRDASLAPASQGSCSQEVTNLNDAGPGSLRVALACAPEGATIVFNSSLGGMLALTSGPLVLAGNVTIVGLGARGITIDGTHNPPASPVFHITKGPVTLTSLTISGGTAGGILVERDATLMLQQCVLSQNHNGTATGGGGLTTAGTVTLNRCQVSNNQTNTRGGGIAQQGGRLTITNTTLSGNSAAAGGGIALDAGDIIMTTSTFMGNHAGDGGGIAQRGGTIIMTDSTLASNSAGANGGGVKLEGGAFNLTRCTLTANTAGGSGGGVWLGSRFFFTNCTFTANRAATGGGVFVDAPPVPTDFNGESALLLHCTVAANVAASAGGNIDAVSAISLMNTIVAQGSAPAGTDIHGAVASRDNNLIEHIDSTTLSGATAKNIYGRDPMLATLKNNGGLTQTLALLPGSPCIDHIIRDDSPVRTDQRSLPRGYDGFCDIGAFEVQ
jgi:hypothetical protein